jgi:chemotaxis protein histidine kinase CheA
MSNTDGTPTSAAGVAAMAETSKSIAELLENARSVLGRIEQTATAAEAAKTAAQSHQAQAASLTTELQARQKDVAEVVAAVNAAKEQITSLQAVIAEKSAHIEGAQKHADSVRANLDKILTTAQSLQTEADASKTRAQSAADGATELQNAARTAKSDADTDAAALKKLLEGATADAAKTKALADKASIIEKRIAEYEARLAELRKESEEQLKQITGLLPGATSAGLASAFDKRRQTFLEPGKRWQYIFIGSLGLLVLLAGTGLIQSWMHEGPMDFHDVATLWLIRLPIAGALVWAALHSSRESALANRLEEDYGYKATVASSFQGFQRQMKEIAGTATEGSALSKLCEDTLSTLASPPGRIYDKHSLTTSPSKEISDFAADVAKATVNAMNGKK